MYPSSSVILPIRISLCFFLIFLLLNYSLYSLINSPLSSLFRSRVLMTEMEMRTEPWIWAGLEGWGRAVEAQCWPLCSPCRPSGRPCSTATATRWARQTAGTCLWTTPRSNAWTRTTRRYTHHHHPHPDTPWVWLQTDWSTCVTLHKGNLDDSYHLFGSLYLLHWRMWSFCDHSEYSFWKHYWNVTFECSVNILKQIVTFKKYIY